MFDAPLSLGAYGAPVARLQELLGKRGFKLPGSEVDRAFFGPATRGAVRRLQQQSGLPITGAVDEQTANALGLSNATGLGIADRAHRKTSPSVPDLKAKNAGLMIDRNGLLNVASIDLSYQSGWQGLATVGTMNLVPGSPVAVLRETETVFAAFAVDRSGLLNIFSLDLSTPNGWQGPDTVGGATLVAGAPVSALKESESLFAALMVDRDGMLNVASLDLSTPNGWQGLDTVGTPTLVPGSRVTVLQENETLFVALAVDENGVLNVASLDLNNQQGWQGLDTIGTGILVPGSRVAVL